MRIRAARASDLPSIAAISDASILTEAANFAGAAEGLAVWEERFRQREASDRYPWFVAAEETRAEETILGFAKAGAFREKSAYDWLAETSVYLEKSGRGRGLGFALYEALIAALRERGFQAALGVISLPNEASVALHERCGFEKVGHLDRAGWKFDRWWDVGFWRRELNPCAEPPPAL
jgi:L-amino acid N-acyltransferase YncA